MYDISIFIPGIRPHNWEKVYHSVNQSCKKYSWEILFLGPFDPPAELLNKGNVKYIKTYAQPSVVHQMGILFCDSNLFFTTVDDCTFAENALDINIEYFNWYCKKEDMLLMLYYEAGRQQTAWDFLAAIHLRLPNINPEYFLCCQFMMRKDYFIEVGGLDCQYEYVNEPFHDLSMRLQQNGTKVHISPAHTCIADHMPGRTGDHWAIYDSQTHHDKPIFDLIWSKSNTRFKIDYNNWKNQPQVWSRRFKDPLPQSYNDMLMQNKYDIDQCI